MVDKWALLQAHTCTSNHRVKGLIMFLSVRDGMGRWEGGAGRNFVLGGASRGGGRSEKRESERASCLFEETDGQRGRCPNGCGEAEVQGQARAQCVRTQTTLNATVQHQ